VLVAAVAVWFLGQASELVRFLVLSQLLAFALEPAVIWAERKRSWRRGATTGLLLVGILALLVLFGAVLVPVLARELADLVRQVPAWLDQLNAAAQENLGVTPVSPDSAEQSAQGTQLAAEYMSEHAGAILGAIGGLVGAIFDLFTIGLFTFYLTANGPQIRRALLARMPPDRQRRVLWAWGAAIEKTGGYLYSRGLLGIINGGLMFITLKLVGAPYALLLALFVGVVAEFIPIVGTYIAGALPVMVTLAAVSPGAALIVLVEVLVYQQLENYWLSPRISQKTMELNAGLAFGAAMAGGAVGGFIGAFFALPIAAVVQAFLSTYARRYEVIESDLTHEAEPRPEPEPERPSRWRRGRVEPS
jgi:predicted PurR-regulated permease PerM